MNHNTNHNQQINAWHNSYNKKIHPSNPGRFIGPREWLPQTATLEERQEFSLNYELENTWGHRAKMCKYATHDFKFAWSRVVTDRRVKSCDDWKTTTEQLGNREKVFHVWLVNQRLQAKTRKLLGMA